MNRAGGARPGTRAAVGLTKLLLLFYPPSFRREVGAPLVDDVSRRAAERDGARSRVWFVFWLLRLFGSLLLNAPAAWLEGRISNGRRARIRRARRDRIAGAPVAPQGEGPGGRSSGFSWLDVKLGLRMLLKHPGLTFAGGLGIAVAIGVSVGFFSFMYTMIYPTIPLDEGDRLVGLENWDLERGNEEQRSLHDFVIWREEMRSVEDMSAFRTVRRSLSTGEGTAELVRIAEMTPSGFTLARVPPYMGRTLVPADAEPGAPDVLVIGYDVWRARFAGDPNILGRDVRLGPEVHTIVGVMPEGYAFPESHSYWTAFRESPTDYPRGEGPAIFISGRLAPGYTLEDAKAELAVIGQRMAAEFPDTHARFRAQVMPYVYPLLDINGSAGEDLLGELVQMSALTSLLLLLVGLNVAVLVYARTATRRGEMAVRTALGASRRRIVGQLFAESLVLSVAAAAVGLGLARLGMEIGDRILATEMEATPFWLELGIPWPALVWTLALTVLAAVLTGVIPGLQATGKRVQQNIRQYHGGVGLGLGRTWTTLIVVQVAAAVIGLPLAVAAGWGEIAGVWSRPTYDVDRYLFAYVDTDREGLLQEEAEPEREARAAELERVRTELVRRLEAEPAVVGHSPIFDLPGDGARVLTAVEGAEDQPTSADARGVRRVVVHPDFFPTFDVRTVAGRPLLLGDLDEGAADVAVIDRRFARRIFGGAEPLGRRVRFVTDDAPETDGTERWLEVVGVVENLEENRLDPERILPVMYVPPRPAYDSGFKLMFEVAGADPATLSGRVREAVSEIDPTLRSTSYPLTRRYEQQRLAMALVGLIVTLLVAAVLLLSAAGIHALMSFTVSQRRREIGIRTALGAQRNRLLRGIFGRALAQIGLGVVLGVSLALAINWRSEGEALRGKSFLLLGGMVVVMVCVGLLAALGPARRGLGVAPSEALQSD